MSDQTEPGAPEATATDPDAGPAEDCAACIGARGVLLALAFAAFAAYVAADFATGGRVTAAVIGTAAALRGRGSEGR
jgi:hypothetical protein